MPTGDAQGAEYAFAMHFDWELGLRVLTRADRDLAVRELVQMPKHQRIDALLTFAPTAAGAWDLTKVERVIGEHAVLLSM